MLKKFLSSLEYSIIKYSNKFKFLDKFFFLTSLKKNNLENDLEYNEAVLNDIGANLDETIEYLKNFDINIRDENLSWHYVLFAGLKLKFKKENKNIKKILEIGTLSGEFTRFLSKIFPDTEVYTVDLEKKNSQFLNTYNRDKEGELNYYLKERDKNLENKNIKFYEFNSFYLFEKFNDQKFDIIWIDGNHINPQVSFDIFQSLKLTHKTSVICVDDIIMQKKYYKKKYVSNESFQTLEYLSKINVLNNFYITKRLRKFYKKEKKYISISFLNHDEKN